MATTMTTEKLAELVGQSAEEIAEVKGTVPDLATLTQGTIDGLNRAVQIAARMRDPIVARGHLIGMATSYGRTLLAAVDRCERLQVEANKLRSTATSLLSMAEAAGVR